MKKRLLLLSMVSFSLIGLTGCDIKQMYDDGKQVIVKLGNGETYTANDLFTDYSSTSSGASEYFNAVYDVLIRAVQPKTTQIQNEVDNRMSTFVTNAKEAAANNGTSYKTEQSKALESAGVESLGELEQVYYLDAQKDAYEDAYYDGSSTSEGELTNLLKEYITYYAPYHVRHILVKTSSDSSLFEGKISEDDAKNLYNVVSRLASGNETFGNVAITTAANGDTGSAKEYGNLGIMDLNTSYVSEFKYSIYQYDALYNNDAKENVKKYDELQETRVIGSNEYVTEFKGSKLIPVDVNELSVNHIPYDAFVQINKYANKTTDANGEQVKEGKEKYYPRNILFNQYLNDHRLGVIYRGSTTDEKIINSKMFKNVSGLSASSDAKDDILVDEEGRPILVTRAGSGGDSGYQGIHFIICQRSPFVNTDTTKFSELIDSLLYYYDTTVYNSTDDLPNDKYVTFLTSTRQDYLNKVNSLKSTIKGFDSFMNYRLFEKALSDAKEKFGNVTFGSVTNSDGENVGIDTLIKNYITANRFNAAYNAKESYENTWKSYELLLESQEELSVLKVAEDEIKSFDSSYTSVAK